MITDNLLMITKEEMGRARDLFRQAAERIEDIRYADREETDEELIKQLRIYATDEEG